MRDKRSTIDRLGSETNANGVVRKYTYDRLGNVTSITDRDGTVQRFSYDKLNRRVKEEWFDTNNNLSRTINSTYNAAGELTQISDPDSSYRYSYDLDGRMVTTNNLGTPGTPTVAMNYAYDNVGNMTSMTDSINGTTGVNNARQYDALNRLTVNSQGNKRVDYGYNPLGQVTNKKRFSDITGTNLVAETNHTYDQIDRLTGITHSKGANNIASYTQAYDSNSRITGITNKDGTAAYNYDNTDQLTGADFSFQTDENYTYDNNGNRTNTGYVTGTNNRLLEDPKYRYEYDLVGNRTKRTDKATNELTEYAWDIRDRLTGITVKNAGGAVIKTASYKYDVFDQRISKTVDPDGAGILAATTEKYVYGTNQNIALEFDGNNNLTHRYLFGDGIDQIEADESNGNVLWGLVDHLGSVRDVVDNSGAVRNHIVYDSFGNITSQTNSSVVFRYGYTGREFDKESGQYYYRSRYYDPTVGRFISEDLIGFGGGDSNLNRYVRNRPTGLRDSRGFTGEYAGDLGGLYLDSYDSFSYGGSSDYLTFDSYGGYGDISYGNSYDNLYYDGSTFDWGLGGGYDSGFDWLLGDCGLGSGSSSLNFDFGDLQQTLIAGLPTLKPYLLFRNRSTDADTRFMGGLRALGGLAQTIGGFSFAAAGTVSGFGPGTLGGFLIGLKGLDDTQAGLRTLFTGQATNSLTYDAAKDLTGNSLIATVVDFATSLPSVKALKGLINSPKDVCFVAGTEILTINGYKNIEDVQVGDWVLSDDPTTPGDIIAKQVLQTFVRDASALVDVHINGEKISTTDEHPFWVKDKGWVESKNLQSGDRLQNNNEEGVIVDHIEHRELKTKVYNFEVEGFHTYFVSDLGILVHNECGGIPPRLYHYTNEAGMNGILESQSINPSLKSINPKDVRYGNGQYFSDITPSTKTPAELSKAFINNPFQGRRFTNYIEIDTANLNVVKGRNGVYVIPNESPLNLNGRITGNGKVK